MHTLVVSTTRVLCVPLKSRDARTDTTIYIHICIYIQCVLVGEARVSAVMQLQLLLLMLMLGAEAADGAVAAAATAASATVLLLCGWRDTMAEFHEFSRIYVCGYATNMAHACVRLSHCCVCGAQRARFLSGDWRGRRPKALQ